MRPAAVVVALVNVVRQCLSARPRFAAQEGVPDLFYHFYLHCSGFSGVLGKARKAPQKGTRGKKEGRQQ